MTPHDEVNEERSADLERPRPARASVTGRGDEEVATQVSAAAQQELPEPPGVPLLYTPGQAAVMLAVKESWLRRQAGRRRIPSTHLGKHLRFSHADLEAIVASAQRTISARTRPPRRHQ